MSSILYYNYRIAYRRYHNICQCICKYCHYSMIMNDSHCYCNLCNYCSMILNNFYMLYDKSYIEERWNQSSLFGTDNCFHLVFCNYHRYIRCSFEDRFLLHNHHNYNDNFTFDRLYLSIHQRISKYMGRSVQLSFCYQLICILNNRFLYYQNT